MYDKRDFLKVELLADMEVVTGITKESLSLKLSSKEIQRGAIKDIGANNLAVLLGIASYIDREGKSFPSQQTLADITGLSRPTIGRAVKELIDKGVIKRELETLGGRTGKPFGIYSLAVEEIEDSAEQETNELKDIFQKDTQEESEGLKDIFQKEIKEVKEIQAPAPAPTKKKSSRDYVNLFKELYAEEYDINYIVNYGRDCSLIKNKLMPNFTEQQINQMIIYVIQNYKEKWSKPAYPYPTISQLCGWLGNTAIQNIQQEEQARQERTEALGKADEHMQETESTMELFDSI